MDLSRVSYRPFRSPDGNVDLRSLLRDLPRPADAARVADVLAECATPGSTLIVGIAGSPAAGKTTLSTGIANSLRSTMHVEVIATDGFLYPNDVLTARGLLMRKGFPETYDLAMLSGVLQRVRWGPVRVPGYSHVIYDRVADLSRTIDRPDILLVEGLGFSTHANQRSSAALLDLLLYVDASEDDLEAWYVARFLKFWREAETNPDSFYTRFRDLDEAGVEALARQVWTNINLPNLREHIAPLKTQADFVITKAADHAMQLSAPALGRTQPLRAALSDA